MRRIFLLLVLVFTTILSSCSKQTNEEKKTIVQGFVLNGDSIPIADAKVGVFKMSNNFTANSYQLVQEVKTNEQGYYSLQTEKSVDIVSAAKIGFFDIASEERKLSPHQLNRWDIFLNQGCKVNFILTSPTEIELMCLFTPFGSQCDFSYSSHCYIDKNYVETMCYFEGGDSAVVSYQYEKNHNRGPKRDTTIFYPKGGEVTLSIDYDF